jgi:hypothetical protein
MSERPFACPDCGCDMIVVVDDCGAPAVLGHKPPICSSWRAAREKSMGAIEADVAYGQRCLHAAGAL